MDDGPHISDSWNWSEPVQSGPAPQPAPEERTWPPTEWDSHLEDQYRIARRERTNAERAADRARDSNDIRDQYTLGVRTGAPKTAALQKLADAEARYSRALAWERELERYRPDVVALGLFPRRRLRRGPLPIADQD